MLSGGGGGGGEKFVCVNSRCIRTFGGGGGGYFQFSPWGEVWMFSLKTHCKLLFQFIVY